MRINIDCLRDVLMYCMDCLDYIENGNIWKREVIDLQDIYKSKELCGYQKKDIMYSIMKLKEAGYIVIAHEYPKNETYINDCLIMDVTMKGHQFAETIKEPNVWDKTKGIVSKIGNHTLGFIETVAHDIAVESAKQAITIMMTQNTPQQ